jgi:4-hydroxy-2-oxoheptanedioate aldolase
MLQAATPTKAVLLARPLRFDPDEIRRFLDLGAPGVLCPFINTGEEARKLEACRYRPAGIRGYGP